jgi:hypothetical protein
MPPRGGWRQDHRDFAEWLCQPSDDEMGGKGRGLRKPATITAYAVEHGVPLSTLYGWLEWQDWPAIMAEVAKDSFLNLDPEFFKNWAISLLKPEPNDRLVSAWIRYGRPALLKEKEGGQWQILSSLDAISEKNSRIYANSLRLVRELPLEQRELFLNILDNARRQAEEEETVPDNPVRKSVKLVRLGEEEPDQADQLPALPAPAATTSGDTTRDTTDTTPRYDPGRGIRKPIRKPRDTKR